MAEVVFNTANCSGCDCGCTACPNCDEIGGDPVAIDYADITLPEYEDRLCFITYPGLWQAFNAVFAGIAKRVFAEPTNSCVGSRIFGPYDYDAVADADGCTGNEAGQFYVDLYYIVGATTLEAGFTIFFGTPGAPLGSYVQYYMFKTITPPVDCNSIYTLDQQGTGSPDLDIELELTATPCP